MAQIDIEKLNSDIAEFVEKYETVSLETPEELDAYIADADKLLAKYPDPEGEAREILGDFCSDLGYEVVVFGNDFEHGLTYHHKSIELFPNSFDVNFEYFITLEKLIANDKLRTPELIQEAIDCLQFCIDYCDTPELMQENCVNLRYQELARVYLVAKQPEKAIECTNKSLETEEIIKKAKKQQGFFARHFARFKRR